METRQLFIVLLFLLLSVFALIATSLLTNTFDPSSQTAGSIETVSTATPGP